jgi:hypothetical protein
MINRTSSIVLSKPFISLLQIVDKHSKFLQGELVTSKRGKGNAVIKHTETAAEQAEAKKIIEKIFSHNSTMLPTALHPEVSPELPFYLPGDDTFIIPAALLP